MSRFNSEAYDKLFPRTPDPVPAVETPVETFRPSQSKAEEKPVDPIPSEPSEDQVSVGPEEMEVNDDNGSAGEPDPE